MVISIVVPTLNEAENVESLVRRIMAGALRPEEILFVDDGSSDGTGDRVQALAGSAPVRLLTRDAPTLGLSGAVLAGARAARGEVLIVMDADLSHPPERIADLAGPIVEGRADMVIGSRYVVGGSTPGWPLWRRVMSRVAAGAAFPLTGTHDSMSGFFCMRRDLLLELTPNATGFKIAFETIVHGRGLRVMEIPIVFHDRAHGISKMTFEVALLFSGRWLAAVARKLFRRRVGQRSGGRASHPPEFRDEADEKRERGEEGIAVSLRADAERNRQREERDGEP